MKKSFIITILVGTLVCIQAQVVNCGDSNYMSYIYDYNPPLNGTGGPMSVEADPLLGNMGNDFRNIQYGRIYAVDSVEHIYGIALTADTVTYGYKGQSYTPGDTLISRRDQSLPVGLYLYNVPRGSNEPILLDSILVDCTKPYKQFVYHAFDTYAFPHEYLHDTVMVYESLFSREHVFGPDDSVYITYFGAKTPPGFVRTRYDYWNILSQEVWVGNHTFYLRNIWLGAYTYLRSAACPGPIFPIRHRACPKMEGLRVDSVDGTRVWISWPPVDSAAFYHLEYGPRGHKYGCGLYSLGAVVEVDSITGTSYCISDTDPDEVYTYFVSAYCPTMKQFGMPDSVTIAANDLMTCPRVEGLRIDSLLPDGVRLAWDTVPGQKYFQLHVRRDDTAAYDLQPSSNPYDLVGLRENILYTVTLRAQCQHLCPLHDTLVWGRWGRPVQFTLERDTSQVGTAEVRGTLRVAVMPNPAHSSVTIVTEGLPKRGGGTIVITDAAGRRILSEPLVADSQQVDIADLRAGVYFVTITTPQGSATAKLAVE